MEKKIASISYLILFLLTGFVNTSTVYDVIGIQWYYLSIINCFSLVYFIFRHKKLNFEPIKFFKSSINLFYLFFFLTSSISLLWAINMIVSVDTLSKIFISLFSLFILSQFEIFKYITIKRISIIFSIILSLEVYFSIRGYFDIISVTDFEFGMASKFLKGVTGNKNITSASIAFKLPFLYYLIYNSKNILFKATLILLTSFAYFNLILLSSRAIILTTFLSITFILIANFISILRTREPYLLALKRIIIYLIPIIIAVGVAYPTLDQSVRIENRVESINENDESASTRIRYYTKGISYFLENPLIGSGLGNFQIISIQLDKENIKSYIVPYVAHNDFIELLTEVGLFGTLFYLLFVLSVPYFLFKIFFTTVDPKVHLNLILLSLPFIAYFVDANLNFPQYRPIMQVSFIVYIMIIHEFYKSNFRGKSLR